MSYLLNKFYKISKCTFVVPIFLLSISLKGSWTNWRGPNYNGASDSTAALPEKFDNSNGVKWKAQLPGASAATPIVVDDRIFIPSISVSSSGGRKGEGKLLALCYSSKSGELLWSRNAGSGYRPGKSDGFDYMLHDRSNYASPSPVVGKQQVYYFYGNGDLVAYDFQGDEKWRRNLQKDYGDFCFQWTFSASPTFFDQKLYLPILQRNEPVHGRGKQGTKSFLLCVNPDNGKTIWKHNRPSNAQKESLESFGTIIPYKNQLLVAGGDVLSSHDPKTGKELWRWGTWNPGHKQQWWRLVPSPVVGDGVGLVCAPKKAPVFAINLNQKGTNSGAAGLRWDTTSNPMLTSDVPTPLFYRGHFFILSDLRKNLSAVEPKTGKALWTIALPGKYKWRSSPTAGDGKIYTMNHNGTVLVISSKTGEILNQAEMGGTYDDNTRSSIAISGSNLFIRTNKYLYCIE